MLALRVNYVGELGWELHAPIEYMAATYQALWRAGEEFGIRDFGMYAMDSLRLEKGYRGWKGDLTHEYTPLMAGLDRFVAFDKPDFIGKAALLAERAEGPKERLVSLVLDEAGEVDPPYCSPVFARRRDRVGLTVSAGLWPRDRQGDRARLCTQRLRRDRHEARDWPARVAGRRDGASRTPLRSGQCPTAELTEGRTITSE